jgi:integrase
LADGSRWLPDEVKTSTVTVADVWELYKSISERDNGSWKGERSVAKHLLRHLGSHVAEQLTEEHVDQYRDKRFAELTIRKKPPSPKTLDNEVELLKRALGYATRCGRIAKNPLEGVGLLNEPNVRTVVLDEAAFQRVYEVADERLKPLLVVAFDGGLRLGEVLMLRRGQVVGGALRFTPHDDKEEGHKLVPLSSRAAEAIRSQPVRLHSPYVFVNPKTGRPWYQRTVDQWRRKAVADAGLPDVWFHDTRRSFITNARRAGIPESVIMKITGHKTREVFERYNIVNEDDVRDAVALMEARRSVGGNLEEVRAEADEG